MPILRFTVDSALLRELGEHLITKPFLALAELVKNSYDADATKVKIELDPIADRIVVTDDGHGMDLEDFKNFWMRVGSTHKRRAEFSKKFKRRLVGSKGIGRFAVQFLAEELEIRTVSEGDPKRMLIGRVRWADAVRAGNLTEASVEYQIEEAAPGEAFEQGTTIVLQKLKHEWNEDLVKELAKELWWLRPPFHRVGSGENFEIEFHSPVGRLEESFQKWSKIIMDAWHARLVGKNENGTVTLSLQFEGSEEPIVRKYQIPLGGQGTCRLRGGSFDIRIYSLTGRQKFGIRVKEAREYFKQFGGVHVYDGGFPLPFYGNPENDWLSVEVDHSHRLSRSKLLPSELQVKEGMTYLPTLTRMLGVVNVDTSQEPELRLSITRDRLHENEAYVQLRNMVRWALDYYANEEAKRVQREKLIRGEVSRPKFERIEEVLSAYEPKIPETIFRDLRADLRKTVRKVKSEAEQVVDKFRVLAPLAAAGISSLAAQHEIRRLFNRGDIIVEKMRELAAQNPNVRVAMNELADELSYWFKRVKDIYSLFGHMIHPEDVKEKKRLPAKMVVERVIEQVKPLVSDVSIKTERIDNDLYLPPATFAEWSAVFQNVFLNAYNALRTVERKLVDVSSKRRGRTREILVQDTGRGVDLEKAETLFEPFVRETELTPEMRAAGYGGMGLGLTIVRMIVSGAGGEVSFVPPEKGFSTALSIRWREEA